MIVVHGILPPNYSIVMKLTGLDGISIINLKRTGVRKIRRRLTTKHIFTEGDVLYLKSVN